MNCDHEHLYSFFNYRPINLGTILNIFNQFQYNFVPIWDHSWTTFDHFWLLYISRLIILHPFWKLFRSFQDVLDHFRQLFRIWMQIATLLIFHDTEKHRHMFHSVQPNVASKLWHEKQVWKSGVWTISTLVGDIHVINKMEKWRVE